jgi:hypothetical protein
MLNKKTYPNIIDAINDIAEEINTTLNDRLKDRYFDGVVLLFSFIENLLKSMVYVKLLWSKSDRMIRADEVKAVRQYCKGLSFYDAQQVALALDLIDMKLYKRIDAIRKERNDVIHQFWLYVHRGNRLVLRKKLEKLAGVASSLVDSFNTLSDEVGVLDLIDVFV